MGIAIKICGINTAAAADAAIRARADFGGLVFFDRSPRVLTLEAGVSLASRMRGRMKLVALVVNEADAELARIAEAVKPDFFQFHGTETPQRVAEIVGRYGIPAIKAFHIAELGDLGAVSTYDDVAQMFLFDTLQPKGASRPGGHGVAFDWKILADWKASRTFQRPWFLAGGLHPENVARAISISGAQMVDVSSGVESAPGVKNERLIADFAAAAKDEIRA